jgi:hypothetical protein
LNSRSACVGSESVTVCGGIKFLVGSVSLKCPKVSAGIHPAYNSVSESPKQD